jgi:hypothetical protein
MGFKWGLHYEIAVSLIESSQKIGRSHHRHRPGRDIFSRCTAGTLGLVIARYAATSFFDQLNSVRSIHIRCRMTASLRATATVAFRSPLRLASLIPPARPYVPLRDTEVQPPNVSLGDTHLRASPQCSGRMKQGSSMARAPVQAGDAGSSPAPVANLQEERRRLGAMISYGRPKLAELSARLERGEAAWVAVP